MGCSKSIRQTVLGWSNQPETVWPVLGACLLCGQSDSFLLMPSWPLFFSGKSMSNVKNQTTHQRLSRSYCQSLTNSSWELSGITTTIASMKILPKKEIEGIWKYDIVWGNLPRKEILLIRLLNAPHINNTPMSSDDSHDMQTDGKDNAKLVGTFLKYLEYIMLTTYILHITPHNSQQSFGICPTIFWKGSSLCFRVLQIFLNFLWCQIVFTPPSNFLQR